MKMQQDMTVKLYEWFDCKSIQDNTKVFKMRYILIFLGTIKVKRNQSLRKKSGVVQFDRYESIAPNLSQVLWKFILFVKVPLMGLMYFYFHFS